MDATKKYWAFISYSHRDKSWGDWLHRALETYRFPKTLVGTLGREGAVPRRVYPIFRDREELPTSADLGTNISEALDQVKPDIVFNMLEEFDGQVLFDQHVVSFLELKHARYTGCNPRGLTLAHDKALSKKNSGLSPDIRAGLCGVPPGAQGASAAQTAVSVAGEIVDR